MLKALSRRKEKILFVNKDVCKEYKEMYVKFNYTSYTCQSTHIGNLKEIST